MPAMQSDLFSQPKPPERQVLSISDLNRSARQLLESHFQLLWVEGELSNFASPSSGHWYFTLKDDNAQVRCAMFRGRNSAVRFKPEQGQQVLVRARVSLYEGRGDYQLIVEHMEEAGFGVLQRAFEALKAKLSKEGLFDQERKRPLPELPNHIAVITSPSGAAIRDVLSVLERRFAAIPVTIIPVPVQGEGAAQKIVEAVKIANERNEYDVILLTRGGGSLEDLWPFNEETVARAIASSELPVVSAVGHEVDVTIADFVADVRAPTPSAAAELISPDGEAWLDTFISYEVKLEQAIDNQIEQWRERVQHLRSRLRHPGDHIRHRMQQLDYLSLQLQRALQGKLREQHNRLRSVEQGLQHNSPSRSLREAQHHIAQLGQRLQRSWRYSAQQKGQQLARCAQLLEAVNPLHVLARGYSATFDAEGQVVKQQQQLAVGDTITTRLGDGECQSVVSHIQANDDN